MSILKSSWLWISAAVLGTLALIRTIVKSLLFKQIRISRTHSAALFDLIQQHAKTMVLHEEITKAKIPIQYDALCWMGSSSIVPFRFTISERILRTGNASTDSVATISMLRWKIAALLEKIKENVHQDDAAYVYILDTWDAVRLGKLSETDNQNEPYYWTKQMDAFRDDIVSVKEGTRKRASALLYGPPGNGKSYFVRYLAVTYRMPIYLIVLLPGHDNQDIIKMFRFLEGPAIVLFEDLDCYFNRREPIHPKAAHSFDALLNVLDGTYADLDNIVTVVTCNDLSKVDAALQHRPGRLRHVIELGYPSDEIQQQLLVDFPSAAEQIKRLPQCSLDEILSVRDAAQRGAGVDMVDALLQRRRDAYTSTLAPKIQPDEKPSEETTRWLRA